MQNLSLFWDLVHFRHLAEKSINRYVNTASNPSENSQKTSVFADELLFQTLFLLTI